MTEWMWAAALGAPLAVVVVAIGLRQAGERRWAALMRSHTARLEAGRVQSPSARQPGAQAPLSRPLRFDAHELEGLAPPMQRYFRAVLTDGQLIVGTTRIEMTGKINLSASAEQWKPFTSMQQVVCAASGARPGFLWDARIALLPGLPVRVEDSYIAGLGRLVAKVFGLFTMAEVQGGGELARGEFMRYFAEAPWYPTALLPSQGVVWQAVDDRSAKATLVDGQLGLTLLFRFNDADLISSVRAESRGAGVGKDLVMLPWECGFSDYRPLAGMLIPMAGEAAWIRPDGRKPYFLGQVKKLSHGFLA